MSCSLEVLHRFYVLLKVTRPYGGYHCQAAVSTLSTKTYINKYRAIFEAALEGVAVAKALESRKAYVSCLNPFLCAFLRTV